MPTSTTNSQFNATHQETAGGLTPSVVIRLLREHQSLWIGPAIAGLVLTALVCFLTPKQYRATQGLILRSETAGYANQRLGKFTDLSEMRTVQETVLELARSRAVLTAALESVGPEPSFFSNSSFPSLDDVESLRDRLRVSPPGGAEFGKTEVFYVAVTDQDTDRAVQLTDAIVEQLQEQLQAVRNGQASSMASELNDAVQVSRDQLLKHTGELSTLEQSVGADLAELRALVSPIGTQSELGQKIFAIEAELRQNGTQRRQATELLATLKNTSQNPQRLLATPSSLLASQPALQRLKDGLLNAQIRVASLQGTRSASHPFVTAAKEAELQMRQQFYAELPIAMEGLQLELSLSEQRDEALKSELTNAKQRLSSLAGQRAEYSRLLAQVENQTRLVDAAEAQLADARAHLAGASSASVLARVGEVEASSRSIGPSRASVSLAGGLGGLLIGVGLVFAFHAPRIESQMQPQDPSEVVATPVAAPMAQPNRATAATPIARSEFGTGQVANPWDIETQPTAGFGYTDNLWDYQHGSASETVYSS